QATWGDTFQACCGPKWVRAHGWALGHAGDGRVADLLKDSARDLLHHLARPIDLTERLRLLFDAHGIAGAADGDGEPRGARRYGQAMILARPGAVSSLAGDLALHRVRRGMLWAEGSGESYAAGAGHALARTGQPAPEVLRAAVRAAMTFDPACGGRVWTACLGGAASAGVGRGRQARRLIS
ncbi:MAG: hypothetical protein RII27_00555, partial [Alphaproteobacteria bacterium]